VEHLQSLVGLEDPTLLSIWLQQEVLAALVVRPQHTKLVEVVLVDFFNLRLGQLHQETIQFKLVVVAMVVHLDLTVVMEQ
jgi:hypothetical protein